MTTTTRTRRIGAPAAAVGRLLLAVAALPVAGCSPQDLLEAEVPGLLEAEKVQGAQQAQLLVNGVIADFECAHGAFVSAGGLMGDELEDAQLAAAVWSYDRRDFNAAPSGIFGTNACNGQLFGVYTPLSTARWSADNALTKLEGWSDAEVPNRQAHIATAAVYAGFSLAELGMTMCSAALDKGPEIDSQALFREAEQRFGRAVSAAEAAGKPNLRTAALAGRARVRLYLGDRAGAAADARLVPPGFVFEAGASDEGAASRRWNRVFHHVNFSRFHMVEEGSRGLTTGGVVDPRTAVVFTQDRALDGRSLVAQTKYASRGAALPITRHAEARLILAEAEGGPTAIAVIDALRSAHGLPGVGPAEAAALATTLAEERRRELWLEGQRLFDIRRLQLPLRPAPGDEFAKGGVYGNATCLPLPDIERFNNPNIG